MTEIDAASSEEQQPSPPPPPPPPPPPLPLPPLAAMTEIESPSAGHPERPPTFDFIEQRKWNDLLERIRAHPEDASFVLSQGVSSAHGNLALHEACKNQPPIKVVEALIHANPEAVRTKGRWGYTPLHYACSSGASADVVSKLIKVFPASTRIRDESNEILPIHLAAKWGASEAVLMSILTTHPEGCFLKDASGKTPMDHAKSLPVAPIRDIVIKALEHGPTLCAVSKSAMSRLEHENECRIKSVTVANQLHFAKLQKRHEEEISRAAETEEILRKELLEVKAALEAAHQAALAKDQQQSRLEDQIKKLRFCLDAQHRELNGLLVTAEDKIEALEARIEENDHAAAGLAEVVASQERTIVELTNKLDVHVQAEEALASKVVALEKAKIDKEQELNEVLKQCESHKATGTELSRSLDDSARKHESYVRRMQQLQKWAAAFSYSIQSWSLDSDWAQHIEVDEGIQEAIAQIESEHHPVDTKQHIAEMEKSLAETDTDESSASGESEQDGTNLSHEEGEECTTAV